MKIYIFAALSIVFFLSLVFMTIPGCGPKGSYGRDIPQGAVYEVWSHGDWYFTDELPTAEGKCVTFTDIQLGLQMICNRDVVVRPAGSTFGYTCPEEW